MLRLLAKLQNKENPKNYSHIGGFWIRILFLPRIEVVYLATLQGLIFHSH